MQNMHTRNYVCQVSGSFSKGEPRRTEKNLIWKKVSKDLVKDSMVGSLS